MISNIISVVIVNLSFLVFPMAMLPWTCSVSMKYRIIVSARIYLTSEYEDLIGRIEALCNSGTSHILVPFFCTMHRKLVPHRDEFIIYFSIYFLYHYNPYIIFASQMLTFSFNFTITTNMYLSAKLVCDLLYHRWCLTQNNFSIALYNSDPGQ
jgi:hypothetical protein